jgi:hypothetical protein
MMIYAGVTIAGSKVVISVSGTFTDQGVAAEQYAAKPVGMRTAITIEDSVRHVFELYFTPPAKPEVLATRRVYMTCKRHIKSQKRRMLHANSFTRIARARTGRKRALLRHTYSLCEAGVVEPKRVNKR